MTLSEYEALPTEERQIVIAELCGWTHEDAVRGHTLSQFTEKVPYYLNDLNACHAFEDALIMGEDLFETYESYLGLNWHASAEERCAALVLTMGEGNNERN